MGWAPPESKLSDNAGIRPGQDNVQIEGNYTIIRGSRVNISIILFCSLNYTMNNICATWSKCYSQSVHVVAFLRHWFVWVENYCINWPWFVTVLLPRTGPRRLKALMSIQFFNGTQKQTHENNVECTHLQIPFPLSSILLNSVRMIDESLSIHNVKTVMILQ